MTETIVIEPRFCGPERSGNGGYVSGLMAAFIEGPARVSLRSPPPLATPIRVEAESEGIVAYHGDTMVGMAEKATVAAQLPAVPSVAAIEAARARYEAECDSHPLPHCFVCGPRRSPGDGLRLFTGPVDDSPVNADFWTPHESLGDEQGLVRPEFLWAALDCPGAFSLRMSDRLCLLGALAADVRRRPKVGERLVVMGWPTGSQGRKHGADSAVIDADGAPIAIAHALWIEIRDPQFLKQLKSDG